MTQNRPQRLVAEVRLHSTNPTLHWTTSLASTHHQKAASPKVAATLGCSRPRLQCAACLCPCSTPTCSTHTSLVHVSHSSPALAQADSRFPRVASWLTGNPALRFAVQVERMYDEYMLSDKLHQKGELREAPPASDAVPLACIRWIACVL